MYKDGLGTLLRRRKSCLIRLVCSNLALMILYHGYVYADTHYVDLANPTSMPPYTSWASAATNIQAAVDSASTNDTILVTNGTYSIFGEILISQDISLQSVNGPKVTIIDAGDRCRCLHLGGQNIVVDGFTIANGMSGKGAGLHVPNKALLRNCVITNNRDTAYSTIEGGGGCSVTGSLALNQCAFYNNTAINTRGGAIHLSASGALAATNCTFSGNRSDPPSGAGGAIFQYPGSTNLINLINCVFRSNTASYGGAVSISDGAFVSNSIFEENSGSYGGAIYSGSSGVLDIDYSIFAKNSASSSGGAIKSYLSDITADNCMFFSNSSGGTEGGAIDTGYSGSNYATHCEFVENRPISVTGVTILNPGLNPTFSDLDLDGADTYSEWVWNHDPCVAETPFSITAQMPASVTIPPTSSERHYSLEGTADLTSTNWTSIHAFTGCETSIVVDVNSQPYIFYRVRAHIP